MAKRKKRKQKELSKQRTIDCYPWSAFVPLTIPRHGYHQLLNDDYFSTHQLITADGAVSTTITLISTFDGGHTCFSYIESMKTFAIMKYGRK